VSEKYALIDAEYAALAGDEACAPAVAQACEWLEVSKSGYYEWRSRPQSAASKRRELLKLKIKALFDANNGEYGYRRIHAALARGGEQADDETVRRLMRELGLEPCQPRPWRHSLTEQGEGRADPGPRQPRFRRRKARRQDGRRHNLYSDLGGLGLPCDRN
jgi:putative transposase